MEGIPRYLSLNGSVQLSDSSHTRTLLSTVVLGIKKTLQFAALTNWPELSQYINPRSASRS
jgi:hypothetical protein